MSTQRPRDDQDVPLLIQGLIGELPPRGQKFPREKRDRWLEALRVNLDLIYGDADDADITREDERA